MDIKLRAYVYLVASMLIGSFTPALLVLTKGANPYEFFLVASLLSIPFAFILVFKNNKFKELKTLMKDRKKIFYMAIASILIYATYEYGLAYSEHFISASLATVLFRVNPLLMLLFLPTILRERLSRQQVLALSLAFIGILIGFSGGNPVNILSNPNIPMVSFVIMLAFGYALANVIIKWQMFDSDLLLPVSGVVLSGFFGLMLVGTGLPLTSLTNSDLAIIVYLAVTNIFSFYMYFHALKLLKTTIVTNIFSISPFLTIAWSSLLFKDQFKLYYLAIAALVGAGMIVQRADKVGGSFLSRRKNKRQQNFTLFDVTGAFVNSGETAIVKAIKDGGRVLALKLEDKHRETLGGFVAAGNHTNVFTDEHAGIQQESDFVKEVVGAKEGDMVIMKAGDTNEGETFFESLSNAIESGDIGKYQQITK